MLNEATDLDFQKILLSSKAAIKYNKPVNGIVRSMKPTEKNKLLGGGDFEEMKNKWIDRKFEFDSPPSIYVEQIKRLKNTPQIIENLIAKSPAEFLTTEPDEGWTIQQNAGHLLSLEDLFIGRLDDYENSALELRPADMTNQATEEMDYNKVDINKILTDFREKRNDYIARLKKHDVEFFGTTAWHPRLKKPMRLCDMLLFQAEHDEHHLNRIRELISIFAVKT